MSADSDIKTKRKAKANQANMHSDNITESLIFICTFLAPNLVTTNPRGYEK